MSCDARYINARTVSRWALLETFAVALAERDVSFVLHSRSENEDGRFHFGSHLVYLDPQREHYHGVEVWRARWCMPCARPAADMAGDEGVRAFCALVRELGPWFLDEPLYLQVPLRTGPNALPRVPELTVQDLEQMRRRQRGG